MSKRIKWFFTMSLVLIATAHFLVAQNYLYSAGNPTFSVNIPVDNGFISVSNGNLHLDFPLATHKQRGSLQLNERLVYDSRFWMIGHYSNYYWWPNNVPSTSELAAGWRFVDGNEHGLISHVVIDTQTRNCDTEDGVQYYAISTLIWTDPSGTQHKFDPAWTESSSTCTSNPSSPSPKSMSGLATDGSGYQITASGMDSGFPTDITIKDVRGNQVYPTIIDRYGNFWTADSSGNLIDDLGRTPVKKISNGNQIDLEVLTIGGERAAYTVTTTSVPINTHFNQQAVTEWSGSLKAIHSIVLPDGTSYEFGYDGFGMINDMKLPGGGHVYFGYTDFMDSYHNKNHWASSVTKDGAVITFTPSVVTYCSVNGTGCKEQVVVRKPSDESPNGDDTVYELTLNNGAWNTSVVQYRGVQALDDKIASQSVGYDFTHSCSNVCDGAMYIARSYETTTLGQDGLKSRTEQTYVSPGSPLLDTVKDWNHYPGSLPTNPDQQTKYTYLGNDVESQLLEDGSGTKLAETRYTYTTTAAATSGIVGHGSQNAGGPYLEKIKSWDNKSGSYLTTTYAMDDTGAVLSVVDPIGTAGTPADHKTTFGYDATNTFITSIIRPSTNGVSHITTASIDFSSGLLLSTNDENSVAHGDTTPITYEYFSSGENIGQLHHVYFPDGGQTSYSYDATHSKLTVEQKRDASNTLQTNTFLDSYGRPVRTAAFNGTKWQLTDTCYNSMGLVQAVSVPYESEGFTGSALCAAGSATINSYDGLGRLISQQMPGSTGTRTWSYDGNVVSYTDEAGRQWVRTQDAFGDLTKVVEPNGTVTTYAFSALGDLHKVTQGSGTNARVRTFTYDSLSRQICAANPEGFDKSFTTAEVCPASATGTMPASKVTLYSYDLNGNVLTRTDPRGVKINFAYDALNRLVSKSYDSDPQQTLTTCFQYDQSPYSGNGYLRGNLTNQWTQTGNCAAPADLLTVDKKTLKSVLGYDAMGRVRSARTCVLTNCPTAFHYTYDLAGNVIESSGGPAGLAFTQQFDAMNRLTTLKEMHDPNNALIAPPASGAQYGPAGLLKMNAGANLVTERSYDSRMRVNGQTTKTR